MIIIENNKKHIEKLLVENIKNNTYKTIGIYFNSIDVQIEYKLVLENLFKNHNLKYERITANIYNINTNEIEIDIMPQSLESFYKDMIIIMNFAHVRNDLAKMFILNLSTLRDRYIILNC